VFWLAPEAENAHHFREKNMTTTFKQIALTTKNYITTITLNTKYNLFNPTLFSELSSAVHHVQNNPNDTRVIVLQNSANSQFFSAGLDLKAYASLFGGGGGSAQNDSTTPPPPKGDLMRTIQEMQDTVKQFRTKVDVPVLASIDGNVIGAGLDLISFCDMRFATKRSTVSLRETKMGIVADLGSIQRLANVVGNGRMRLMAFTGNDFDANWCKEAHLFDEVYQDRQSLEMHVQQVASDIASNSPLTVQGTKRMINFSEDHTLEQSLEMVRVWNSAFLKSEDLREAVMSFLQKRKPQFRNRF